MTFRQRTALGVATLVVGFIVASPGALHAQLAPKLEGLLPFVGKTWRAPIDPDAGVYDVARWDIALAGQAVRILHSVGDGSYGGETIIVWDEVEESIVYFYFTTAGFYTRGTMRFDEQGLLHTHEYVTGGETGVSEIRGTHEILPDGTMRVSTEMLRGNTWEHSGVAIYVETPDAKVVLPDSSTGVTGPAR